jgi:serine/threonine protein kinase
MANLENNSISGEMPAPNLTDLSGTGAFRNSMIGAGTSGSLASLQAGHVLGGRFAILKQIGTGGMGAVYQAHDRNRGDDIAIKVMLPELVSSDIAKQRFVNEAKVAIKLAHQNIVNTYDVLTDGAYLFITMELLEGRSLRQDLEARKRANRPYTEAEALEITYALCDALEYAHDYTVHRDIKPENIWITSKGRVKLMDFGLARMLNGSQMSQTTSGLGTAYYVAPEQLVGSKELDGRADQYSLGIMLYELLAGQVPAGRAQSVRQLRNDVSAVVSDAIDRALSSNPQDRYPNMRTFADVLRGTNQSAGQASPKVIKLLIRH